MFSKIPHFHLIKAVDIATGVSESGGVPVTAIKHRCVLCNREYVHVTKSGTRQMDEGYKMQDVIKWIVDA